MTLYYDSEKEAVVENHGEEYASFTPEEGVGDEDGLVFDTSEPRKAKSLAMAAVAAMNDHPEFQAELDYEWVPEEERE